MEILKIEGLNKFFGKRWVLKDVNLSFYKGEISVITGPNASGKSTFLKCLLGLVIPSSGKIRFNGEDIIGKSMYRRYFGYMPQNPSFPLSLTPRDIFELMVEIYGKDRVEDPERYIERFSLGDHWKRPIGTLSGGTRQKVNAVLALSVKAEVYLLDEPTSSLDPKSSIILKEEILKKKREGSCIILVTHIIPSVEYLADNLVYFLDGRVRFSGRVKDLKLVTRESNLEGAIAKIEDVENI